MNQYPAWKYLLVIVVLATGMLYAFPNVYGKDPALIISPVRANQMTSKELAVIKGVLKKENIQYSSIDRIRAKLLIRFPDTENQLKATDQLGKLLEGRFIVAQNLAPATPDWLRAINGRPMSLGLDLQGGIHFLMEVDMDAAIKKEKQRFVGEIKTTLRDKTIRHAGVRLEKEIMIRFRSTKERARALEYLSSKIRELQYTELDKGGDPYLMAELKDQSKIDVRKAALTQNITTLRNRVNELGVAEPVIQQNGDHRIIVQLPGVQNPDRAKDILGATATLEVHLVDERNPSVRDFVNKGRAPPGTRIYYKRDGTPVLLRKEVVLTGESITHASSGFDSRSNEPSVTINLDSRGGNRFDNFTKDHVKDSLAVVYIEIKVKTHKVNGKMVKVRKKIEEVINVATIQERLGRRFQITGMDSPNEARNLAILLRAGALAAPIEIIEERTVGPSLGKDNIKQGFNSVIIGFVLVLLFMAVYYKLFGMIANLALFFNLVIVVALLSVIQATLTMPGIAGIVLTVGMAVDANVLIFERIREEIRLGNSPQASIHAGYEKAFATIADANITTLIAAIVLFSFGSGPIKGFAVTLSLGILTSMFTAIMGTRAAINLIYGAKKVKKLSI
ncbi:MAG TPA: protein translocase subunit SecD [Gammaproteobacteria bacterium]|nr:protein translocase subunit SecD [Gammaproteobacteria bacterium]